MNFKNLTKKFMAVAALGAALAVSPVIPAMAQQPAVSPLSWESRPPAPGAGSAFALTVPVEGCTSDGFTVRAVLELDSSSRLVLDPVRGLPNPDSLRRELNAVWSHIASQMTRDDFMPRHSFGPVPSPRLTSLIENEFRKYTDGLEHVRFSSMKYQVSRDFLLQNPAPGCGVQP